MKLYCSATALLFSGVLAAQTPPASVLFDKDTVHEIRLKFSQPDYWQQLTSNYENNQDDVPYIEASLEWGEYKFDVVGARFKGNSSYNGASTKKKPFRIKLNEFTKGQKIDGMASFSLSNGWNDPSFIREKAYYELAAKAGLPTPRSSFAALYINDEYWGLYILTEVVNGDFLKSFFGKGNDTGNLYKADIGASFTYLGAEASPYRNFFEKQSNEEEDDWSDLIELSRLIDQTPAAEFPEKIEPLVDIDSVLTALAVDNLTVNLDSYVSMGQNFYIYRRPSDKRWVWIPWDPSLAFGALSQGLSVQQMKELPLEYVSAAGIRGGVGGPGGVPPAQPPGGPGAPGGAVVGATSSRPLATKLWEVPRYKARYREIYQRMVAQTFVPGPLIDRMNTLRQLIEPWVAKDTQKLVTQQQFETAMTTDTGAGFGPVQPQDPNNPGVPMPDGLGRTMGGIPGLAPFIEGRSLAVKALLAGELPLSLTVTPGSIHVAQVARANAALQTVSLTLPDPRKSADWTAALSADWLYAVKSSGTAPGSLTFTAGGPGYAPGRYTGNIALTVAGVTNPKVSIPVTLTVVGTPSLVASPAALTLSQFSLPNIPGGLPGGLPGGFPGGPVSASGTIQVISTAGVSGFTVTTGSTSCGTFFTVSPMSGTTPATLTVTPAGGTSTSGDCTGSVTVSSAGLEPARVPVRLRTTALPGLPTP